MSIPTLTALGIALALAIGGMVLIAWAIFDQRKARAPSLYDEWRHALGEADYVQDRRNAGDL